MKTKFTPGPWYNMKTHVATMTVCYGRVINTGKFDDNPADLDLIAAAPEMLAALERVLLGVDTTDEVRNIIAKAKGELK